MESAGLSSNELAVVVVLVVVAAAAAASTMVARISSDVIITTCRAEHEFFRVAMARANEGKLRAAQNNVLASSAVYVLKSALGSCGKAPSNARFACNNRPRPLARGANSRAH